MLKYWEVVNSFLKIKKYRRESTTFKGHFSLQNLEYFKIKKTQKIAIF